MIFESKNPAGSQALGRFDRPPAGERSGLSAHVHAERHLLVESPRQTVVLVRAGSHLCGLPIDGVIETMRPLSVSPVQGAPRFLQGVAIVRGEPVPVVDLAVLLGDAATPPGPEARFVTVRAGERSAALAVSAVRGVSTLDPAELRRLPLLADTYAGALDALRARDGDLLLVLGAARLVPDEALAAVAGQRTGA
jgi:purine-binding chemotaxis protein CheW